MKTLELGSSVRVMGSALLALVIGVATGAALLACSGTSTVSSSGDGGAGSGNHNGTSGGSSNGSGSTTDTGSATGTVNPHGSAPGEACNAPADCLIVYCACANASVVNSQRCVDNVCQAPKSSCPGACSGFGSTWSGTADIEKPRSSGSSSSGSSGTGTSSSSSSSSSSSGSSGSGQTCVSYADCPPYTCTCLDGAFESDQGCVNGSCVSASLGCETTCANTGHGGAQ